MRATVNMSESADRLFFMRSTWCPRIGQANTEERFVTEENLLAVKFDSGEQHTKANYSRRDPAESGRRPCSRFKMGQRVVSSKRLKSRLCGLQLHVHVLGAQNKGISGQHTG
ncbi:hypothetical protein EVAR_78626_1 [Eumeta japonica]|uniref:Uncharacterized protein n=1 Tax=Eumeta variegata TaxID=151549 RepID=A0A4C1U8L9_EUMVA|nr:hypothetical protein EVAR_78626_1 [Eumeta japonica]